MFSSTCYIGSVNGGTITNCIIGANISGSNDQSGTAEIGINLFYSENSLIQNNVIVGFTDGSGIGIYMFEANSNIITGNIIGLDATGTFVIPNNIGIQLDHISANNQIINNIISGNILSGIESTKMFSGKTLFIAGGASDYIKPEYKQQTVTLFPNTQLKIIPEASHWLHAEKPRIFIGICQRFLEEK